MTFTGILVWVLTGIGYLAVSLLVGLLALQRLLLWLGSKVYGIFHKPHKILQEPEQE